MLSPFGNIKRHLQEINSYNFHGLKKKNYSNLLKLERFKNELDING